MNWLPAPNGLFYMLMRLYLLSTEILNGQYEIPPVMRPKQTVEDSQSSEDWLSCPLI